MELMKGFNCFNWTLGELKFNLEAAFAIPLFILMFRNFAGNSLPVNHNSAGEWIRC
jgi:hypothetical protein